LKQKTIHDMNSAVVLRV